MRLQKRPDFVVCLFVRPSNADQFPGTHDVGFHVQGLVYMVGTHSEWVTIHRVAIHRKEEARGN